MFCSMKISHTITERFGSDEDGTLTEEEVRAGMLAKSREFAEAGSRVYLPVVE